MIGFLALRVEARESLHFQDSRLNSAFLKGLPLDR